MIFRVYTPDGFLCNLLIWSWEVAEVMDAFRKTFVNPVWDFHYQTVDIG